MKNSANLAAVIGAPAATNRLNAQPIGTRTLSENTLALVLPADTPLPDWLAMGRSLAVQRRTIDWLIGDWVAFGRTHFEPVQIEMALGEITADAQVLRRVEKVAKAFPPHLRNQALSFEHHAQVADMSVQDALPLLKQAERENLTAKALRHRAMDRKIETGQILVQDVDSADDKAFSDLCVAWNRASLTVREDFAERVAESGYRDIMP